MLIRQDIRAPLIRFFYILFFLFFIHRLFFPSFGMAEGFVSVLLYPFLKIQATVSHSMAERALDKQSHQALKHDLDVLKVQNFGLQAMLLKAKAELQFLQETKELRNFAQRYEEKNYCIAKVLLKKCDAHEDMMLIEGGSNHNFKKDDVVVFKQALIGKIVQVYPWYSKVILISDKRCRIASQLQPGVQGICCGQNNKQLQLCFVPHFKEVHVGDIVFSSGQGLIYPYGFALGIVKDVTTDLVAHDIVLQPVFDIHDIEFVYVLNKTKSVVESDSSEGAMVETVSL